MEPNYLNGIVLALALMLAFVLSGMEAGVFALNRLRIRRQARAGKPSAKLLNNFLDQPERFLWTILVGNTLANFLVLGLTLAKIHEWFSGRTVLIGIIFAATVFLFYTFFDLLPKMLFRVFPNQLCLWAARIFRPVSFVLSPLVLLVEGVSRLLLRLTGGRVFTGQLFGNREEMRAVMRESAPTFTSDEHTMINRILDLQDLTVRQVAVPLAKMVAVESQTPVAGALAFAREKKISRLPVWEMRDSRRRIGDLLFIGPLLFHDDLDLQKPASAYMSPAFYVNENVRLEIALRLMQRAGHRLAVVLAGDGRETGIVTLEDILKVMFGEIKL